MSRGKYSLTSIHDPSNMEHREQPKSEQNSYYKPKRGKYSLADILATEDDYLATRPGQKTLEQRHNARLTDTTSQKQEDLNLNGYSEHTHDHFDTDMMDIDDPASLLEINSVLSLNRKSRASRTTEIPPPVQQPPQTAISLTARAGLVLDTNFLISNLNLVNHLRDVANQYGFMLIIPWVVIQELDGLKSLNRKTSTSEGDGYKVPIATLARKATDWIFSALAESDPRVVGQKLTEVCSQNQKDLHGDDGILDCCMYFHKERHLLTVILSNDRNLCNKALIHEIKTVTYARGLTAKAIGEAVQKEVMAWGHRFDSDEEMTMDYEEFSHPPVTGEQAELAALKAKLVSKQDSLTDMRDLIVSTLVSEISESMLLCLAHEYSTPTEYELHVQSLPPIRTLADLCRTFKMHQLSVFADYFNRRIHFWPNPELDTKPKAEVKDMIRFINAWGGVWMQISGHGPRTLEFVQSMIDVMTSSLTGRPH